MMNNKLNNNHLETEYKKILVDANGTSFKVLEDSYSGQYVNIKEITNAGFQIYSSVDSAKCHMISELEEYLTMQAEIFLKVKGLKYDIGKDIVIKIQLENFQNSKFQSSNNNEKSDCLNSTVAISNRKLQSPQDNNGLTRNSDFGINSTSKMPNPGRQTKSLESTIPDLQFQKRNSLKSDDGMQINNINRRISNEVKNMNNSGAVNLSKKKATSTKLERYPEGTAFVGKSAGHKELSVQILKILSPTTFTAFILANESMELDEIMSSITYEKELQSVFPGDYVVVKLETDKISRAFVLELKGNKYKVAMIDYGEVVDVDKVYYAPKQLEQFAEFTCICEAPASYVKDLNDDDGKVMYSNENFKLIDIISKIEIKCRRWEPEECFKIVNSSLCDVKKPAQLIYMDLPTDEVPIKLNELVSLIGFVDGMVCLRSKEMYIKLITMNKEIQEGIPLDDKPKVGQYVLHKTPKNEWRRSLVKKITDSSIYVQYIDYFNAFNTVHINETFNLSETAIFGPTLIKRRLKSFEDKIYTDKAIQKITELTQQKFNLTYLENDVIDLQQNLDKSLSQQLKEINAPAIKSINDLPSISFEYNQAFNIVILYDDADGSFAFSPTSASSDILNKVADLGHMKHEPKIESLIVGQLCVALYDGEWFRGQVQEVNGNKVKVYFIDFGNTDVVEWEFIKPFPDDMMTIGACALKGISTSDSYHGAEVSAGEIYLGIIKKKIGEKHHVQLLRQVDFD